MLPRHTSCRTAAVVLYTTFYAAFTWVQFARVPVPTWLEGYVFLLFLSWPVGMLASVGRVLPATMGHVAHWVALAFGLVIVWFVSGRLFHSVPRLVNGTLRLALTVPAVTFFPLFALNWLVYVLGYTFGVAEILE